MGLDTAAAYFLFAGRALGVDFSDVMMIGRQHFQVRTSMLTKIFEELQLPGDAAAFRATQEYAEPFFELLGARRVESIDTSDYEAATHLHDLNYPLPAELHARYSLVFDGGTLEHVFNIPQALKSCMEMVRPGGHFVQINFANNLMGHGFWQFSPEMVFRVFSPENGFSVRLVMLHEAKKNGRWAVVPDPAAVQDRVQITNSERIYIMSIAQRTGDEPIFASFPQQSDYLPLWEQPRPSELPRKRLPKTLPDRIKRLRRRLFPPRPVDELVSPPYREVSADDVLHGRLFET